MGTKLGETKKTLPSPVVLALVAAENALDPSQMNSTPSTPLALGSLTAWAWLKGRSPARSNTEPRSTKNGSSRWPANTLAPPSLSRVWTAADARAS